VTQLFPAIVLTSAAGTALALLLLLLRPVTRRVFSAGWHYYMWLAVLLVLLLPLRLELPLQPAAALPVMESQVAGEQLPQGDAAPALPRAAETAKTFLQDKTPLLSVLWLTVAAVLFAGRAAGYLNFRRKLYRASAPVECPEVAALPGRRPEVRISAALGAPLLMGVFRPVLLLPDLPLTAEQRQHVLAHELTHFRRHDVAVKWLVSAAVCIHWFNPVLRWLQRQIDADCEIACDRAVVRHMDGAHKRQYAETILLLLTQRDLPAVPLTTGLTAGGKRLKKRFLMIKNKENISKKAAALSVAVAAVLLLAALLAGGLANGMFFSKEPEEQLCGFVREVRGNVVVVDAVEYITAEDTDRIAQLGLTQLDMPNGYYLHDPESETREYLLTEETVYTFIDWHNDFVAEGADRTVTTAEQAVWEQYLSTYENGRPGMPLFFSVTGDTVTAVVEIPMM